MFIKKLQFWSFFCYNDICMIEVCNMKNIFSMNEDELNYNFNEYILEGYPDFNFTYDWSNYSFIEIYLKKLMLKSMAVNSNDSLFLNNLDKYIHDVEDFFAVGLYTDIFTDSNIMDVVDNLNENVHSIKHLPLDYCGCYGRSSDDGIEINTHFSRHFNSPDLSSDEIRKLYMFHELGHNILGLTNDTQIVEYCDRFRDVLVSKGEYSIYDISKEMVYGGFWLLEEALTQELAETLVYARSGKLRPVMREDNELGINFKTNFDYYGIFQSVAIMLGNTMRGIGEYSDDPNILRDMLKRAMNGNFVNELIAEYNDGGANLYNDLGIVLQNMGNILNEKYGTFAKRPFDASGVAARRSYKSIKSLCDKNKDFREYPENGFSQEGYSM